MCNCSLVQIENENEQCSLKVLEVTDIFLKHKCLSMQILAITNSLFLDENKGKVIMSEGKNETSQDDNTNRLISFNQIFKYLIIIHTYQIVT